MKRFVTYLYEYDRTVRGRNVGFIRNDLRGDCRRMEIHIRGLERIKEKAPIYIMVHDGECIGIPAGEIIISQGIGNACLEMHGDCIGKTGYSPDQMQAVIICYGSGKMLMGCYAQHPASDLFAGNFTVWMPPLMNEVYPDAEISLNSGDVADSSEPDTETASDSKDLSGSYHPDTEISLNSDDVADSSESDAETATDSGDISDNTSPPQQDLQNAETASPDFRRIAITDIRSLPSRNWHLCNNSFLIHGFFCYHYLILKTVNAPEGTKQYLGVPGIYAPQERMMALIFGFTDFEPSQDDAASQTAPEGFGYWMYPLEA